MTHVDDDSTLHNTDSDVSELHITKINILDQPLSSDSEFSYPHHFTHPIYYEEQEYTQSQESTNEWSGLETISKYKISVTSQASIKIQNNEY